MEIQNSPHYTLLTPNKVSQKYPISVETLKVLKSKDKGPSYVIKNGKTHYVDELFPTWYFNAVKNGVLNEELGEKDYSEQVGNTPAINSSKKERDNQSKIIGACIETLISQAPNKAALMNGDKPNASALADLLLKTLDKKYTNKYENGKKAKLNGVAEIYYPGLSQRSLRSVISNALKTLS